MENDIFTFTDAHCVRLNGPLGKALDKCCNAQLKTCNAELLSEPFRKHQDRDGGWRGEFFGKVIRSAILAWRSNRDPELLAWIEKAAAALLKSISPDDNFSSVPKEMRGRKWDLWGRKYVLIGLERYYEEIAKKPEIVQAVRMVLDGIIEDVRKFRGGILSTGEHEGLASSSMIGAVYGAWKMTGEQKYLDFVQEIIKEGCAGRHDIFRAARQLIPPAQIGNGKAYEMMSCYKGVSEMLDLLPETYEESVLSFWHLVAEREIMITGTSGANNCGELWFDCRYRQTMNDIGMLGETCVTVTWIQYCGRVLSLSGNPSAADSMELSAYNALLGGMHPDGNKWTHRNPTPLAGCSSKKTADDQMRRNFGIPFDDHDCCRAQGPEGLAQMTHYTLLRKSDGIVINFYEAFSGIGETPSGSKVRFDVKGEYPFQGDVEIKLETDKKERFALYLRIPAWWDETLYIEIGDEKLSAAAGKYIRVERVWEKETIRLHFSLAPRIEIMPGDNRFGAVLCGPVVMVQSSRLPGFNGILPSGTPEEVSFEGFRKVLKYPDGSMLGDYASAGDYFTEDDLIQVLLKNKR